MAAFNEDVGPMPSLNPSISVLGLFQLFFTPVLMANIVEQTNVYARLVLGDARPWREVTENDIWAFFGFCILMGINHVRMYFSNGLNINCLSGCSVTC